MMENTFMPDQGHHIFTWGRLGNIEKGRENLGKEMPVLIYRLMQYTMLDVLSKALGHEQAIGHFRQAGYLAGKEFANNVLDLQVEYSTFVANLQRKLLELKIGILRMESFEESSGKIILTIEEDLDCSGLPITNETVCYYDEGLLAGILEVYTGRKYQVREVDCWAKGDRVCRFLGTSE